MAVTPQLLEQVLRLPEERDVRNSPIVTAIVLADPANAADLVPFLDQGDLAAANARRVLCLFGADAAPHLVAALRDAGPAARMEGLDVLFALLAGEAAPVIRDTLERIAPDLDPLLADQRPLPYEAPPQVEPDFLGRICDQAFLVCSELLDPGFDQTPFRSLDEEGRNREIAQLRRRGLRPGIV
jgi:hypothetical protein